MVTSNDPNDDNGDKEGSDDDGGSDDEGSDDDGGSAVATAVGETVLERVALLGNEYDY